MTSRDPVLDHSHSGRRANVTSITTPAALTFQGCPSQWPRQAVQPGWQATSHNESFKFQLASTRRRAVGAAGSKEVLPCGWPFPPISADFSGPPVTVTWRRCHEGTALLPPRSAAIPCDAQGIASSPRLARKRRLPAHPPPPPPGGAGGRWAPKSRRRGFSSRRATVSVPPPPSP